MSLLQRGEHAACKYTEKFAHLLNSYNGDPLDVSFRELVGPLPSDDLTHSVYPYPARLLRQIPRMLLRCEQIVADIDHVIDPFCGSGTVLLEAQRAGFGATGIEQNPIGALASKVKTTPINSKSFESLCREVLKEAKRTRKYLEPSAYVTKWYSPEAYSALCRLASVIREDSGPHHAAVELTLALTARRTACTDRRIPVPVRPRHPIGYSGQDVWESWEREASALARRIETLDGSLPTATVTVGDTRRESSWSQAPASGRSLVITSPPYGAAQKYIRSSSLELGWLGLSDSKGTVKLEHSSIGREHLSRADKLAQQNISNHRVVSILNDIRLVSPTRAAIYATYFSDMESALRHFKVHAMRVVLVSGTNTVAGLEIATHELLGELLSNYGFRKELSLRDEIRGRALLTKRRASAAPARAEYIDVFEFGQ
ncbi:hypothetical protein [Gordonia sp. HS-NH1]|uniref:hypothetical protein n=1 Tax=Gordonia sp. HS-NH1 TaxID=1435068 RepID=UPI000A42FC45|nr:hypothetical protein [Gordonia sp. HS-NH1]